MPIGEKEVLATYKNHKIRVTNGWFSGAKLYIDGECRDNSSAIIQTNRNSPLLTAKLSDNEIVEVYLIAIYATKIKICVNSEQIGGDVF